MKTQKTHSKELLAAMLMLAAGTRGQAQGTAFTYQGRLSDNGAAVTGIFDLRFIVYDADAGGSQQGPILTNSATPINAGVFTVTLDFASVFDGGGRWLEIAVRTNGGGAFATLSPRQKLTASPYAILAGTVPGGAIGSAQLAPSAVTSVQLAAGAVTSAALASSISLGQTNLTGRLDVYRTAANTPAISLIGSQSQLSTYGADGLEQARVSGVNWGELRLFNSLPNNAITVDLSANSSAGGYLYLNNSNGLARAFLSGANSGGAVQLFDGAGMETVNLNSSGSSWLNGGRLGFGTVSPAAAVHIAGPTNAPTASLSGIDNGLLLGSQGSAGYKWMQSYGGSLALNPLGNNVGIGTTNPAGALLDVEGAIRVNDHDLVLRAGTDTFHGLGYRTYADGPFLYGFNGGALGVSGPDWVALSWTWNGNVSISNNLTLGDALNLNRLVVDRQGTNVGTVVPGITFGAGSGEGIASKRTAGGNRYGLDFYTAFVNRMTILNSGFVGINTTNPAFNLEVNGSAGKPGGGAWSVSSDARLKTKIRPLTCVLDKLLALRGVSFEYKDPEAIHELSGERIGMIAQEVAKIFPDWVEAGPSGYLRLTYRGFEALAVEALREMRNEREAEIGELKQQLAAQKQINARCEARLTELERAVARLGEKTSPSLSANR